MGSSHYEIYSDGGHEEEHEFEEGHIGTPTYRNGSVYVNGIGNGNLNGNEIDKEDSFSLSKRARDNEEQDTGGASENLAQNDPSTLYSSSGRLLTRIFRDGGEGRLSNGTKRLKLIEENEDSGTKEEQAEFVKELEAFYKGRRMDFKPPKFYGVPLNCLKLWRSVVRLGGYDRITTYKLWRQVGESFHPPKTCTTVSWTFRNFYEKSLLEYERYKQEIGELELPEFPEDNLVENEDKSFNTAQKREKYLKNIGVKQKKHNNLELVEHEIFEANKQHGLTILDAGPPADWVKINVRESKDCFEVYALVPGLLREEVRVQSDPAGRLVITGQPEQLDNPWGITPFRKVIEFPLRIDPLHTSAVVSLHGRLFVRVPFDRSSF